MKDEIKPSELKLTIIQVKEQLKNHYGMYTHYMTKESSKEMFDYQQWSTTTIVNGDYIDNLEKIEGLIKLQVWFHYPLLDCDII
jgi:hypothetical protein